MNQKEYTAKLEAISTLEKGWNGYKADPPNPKVIEDAYAFLKLLPEPDSVEVSAMGGIGIHYSNGRRNACVEFYNSYYITNNWGKLAVGLSNDIIIRVVQSERHEPIVAAVQEYLKNPPTISEQQVKDMKPDEIDWLIAEHITELPGLGYYRRKSCYAQDSELCNKGDCTPDMPELKASPSYMTEVGPFAIPNYSGDEALKLFAIMMDARGEVSDRFVRYLAENNIEHYGSAPVTDFLNGIFKKFNGIKICRAALMSVCNTLIKA